MHVLIHTFTFVATPPSSSKENTHATENAQIVYTVNVRWCDKCIIHVSHAR